jgi:hypothetical protein
MAESTPWISPYAYAGNDPINNIDVLGLDFQAPGDAGTWVRTSFNEGGEFHSGGGGGTDYSIYDALNQLYIDTHPNPRAKRRILQTAARQRLAERIFVESFFRSF